MTRPVLVALVLATGVGCNPFRKAKECGALVETVSAWLAEAPEEVHGVASPAQIAADARKTARRYEELDRRLGALNLQSEPLILPVESYRSLALGAARALEEVAVALEKNDTELARRLRVEFDDTKEKERELVAAINGACHK